MHANITGGADKCKNEPPIVQPWLLLLKRSPRLAEALQPFRLEMSTSQQDLLRKAWTQGRQGRRVAQPHPSSPQDSSTRRH